MDGRIEQSPAPALSEREKNAIIAGVLLAMLLAALDQTIVAPAMPTIGGTLGHAEYVPWIVTAYLLAATAMSPLYGKISDIHGRRPTLYAAIGIFVVGSLVCALAPSMLVLIIGRVLQGIGGGGLFALSQTVIGDLVPPRERARYASWVAGTWAVASLAGPLLGGYFAGHLHWSLIFWINLPLAAFAVFILYRPLKKLVTPRRDHRLDVAGAVLLVVATGLMLLALNWGGGAYPWFSLPIGGLLLGSLVLWILFAIRLRSTPEPLISLEVLANPIVRAATLSMFLSQAAFVGLSVYLPIYLQQVLGLSVSNAGFALLGVLLGTVVGAMTSGRLISRFEHYKRIAVAGAALSAVCLVLLGLVADGASLVTVEILTFLIGLGAGTTFPVGSISVQNAVSRADLGVATGVLTFLRSLGGASGVAALGAVALGFHVSLGLEGHQLPPGSVSAEPFAIIFLIAAAIMFLSMVMLVVMPEKKLQGRIEDAPALAD
jgi:EmrB/QacA subfamily drug resistance transporter